MIVCVPIVIAGGAVAVGVEVGVGRFSVVVLEPMTSTGCMMPLVRSMIGVLEAPEPRTRGTLGESVWPAIT